MVTIHLLVLPAEFVVISDAQETVPAPTSNVLSLELVVGGTIVILPDTVSVIPELTVTVVLVLSGVVPIVSERHTAAAFTATVWPLAMITSSPAAGTTPPTQVEALFQLPEPAEVMGAAYKFPVATNKREIQIIKHSFFMEFYVLILKG
jgi:hypothetical protein